MINDGSIPGGLVQDDHHGCVLVVEDDEMLLELFELLLGSRYDVRIARNAEEAVGQLDTHEVAAVVTDLHIGKENGLALLERIRHDYPHLSSRMLLLTGASVPNLDRLGVPVLTKPVNADTLLNAVGDMMTGGGDAVS